MATKYNLTTAFAAITETSGTIQNVGSEAVELASSTNAVEGEGIVLNPGEKRSFKGTLSARSIGDAGAVVNVVDFTEAGEGGEEYILPIASDTTLGGVKISNSFTVANDGTLNIKKSGKTILGAVKSSDDEGKVTVNNDGTMTYNPLGYRQPSTTYEVGNIAYHSALPTGWYLECTTAGTSGSGDLTISGTITADVTTVSDGTVTWIVRQGASTKNLDSFVNDILFTSGGNIKIYESSSYGALRLMAEDNGSNIGPYVSLFTNSALMQKGDFSIGARNNDNPSGSFLTGKPNGTLLWGANDLAGSAIVAKYLGTNGYIKYASGLIMQWGISNTNENEEVTVSLPVSYSLGSQVYRPQITPMDGNYDFYFVDNDRTNNSFKVKGTAGRFFSWVTIGQ